jgi:uncharacterized protein
VSDLAVVSARFGAALRAAGLPVGPDRCERFTRAIILARPATTAQLRWCARTTLAGDRGQIELLDRVFDAVFGGLGDDPADERGDPNNRDQNSGDPVAAGAPSRRSGIAGGGSPQADGTVGRRAAEPRPDESTVEIPGLASAVERLASRDFGELTAEELVLLRTVMSRLRLATPPRRVRRTRPVAGARRIDLRATLRRAHRTGGDPQHLVYQARRQRPRRLVALCDISGSMEPYARAMLQLLYCAADTRAEVFVFATRLTRLTRMLARSRPGPAMERAGRAAPDWSGGTRIGAALAEFNRRYGRPGLARGAVLLVISDGWETGDPAQLGREMARLSRLAYRIVWVNPRTASPAYRPLVGGMAAAWPYCDAVVSAHRLSAVDDLLAALASTVRDGTARRSLR